MVNVLAETEAVSPSLPSTYTLLTQREPGTQVYQPQLNRVAPQLGFSWKCAEAARNNVYSCFFIIHLVLGLLRENPNIPCVL